MTSAARKTLHRMIAYALAQVAERRRQ